MRWKITSTNVSENTNTGIKTTTNTKQFTITIGEAIGIGKTAIGAVQTAAKSLKTLAKANPKASLAPIASTASVLANVIKGLDAYGKVMSVIEKVTPIVQIAARASGMWASPGNAGDIGEIILGQAQKVLMSFVLSTVNNLKDFVWNYEFVLKEIKETFEEPINKNIEKLEEEINNIALGECINDLVTEDVPLDIDSGNLDLSNALDWNGDSDSKWFSEAYETEYVVNGVKRKLRGSLRNLGIQYSDDNGETWESTAQTDGSWYCFAKIENAGSFTYVAGSKDFISSLKESTDTDWVDNKNYYYSDGESNLTITKYYKDNHPFDGLDKDSYEPSKGIYYSSDDGITWNATSITDNINDLCEFEEKENYSATIVASSDDFNGCYYSEDGINWQNAYSEDKWLKVIAQDQNFKRVEQISVVDTCEVSKLKVGIGNIFQNDIIVNFDVDVNNLVVSDPRSSAVIEYYERMAELIAEGKTVDEIYEILGDLP